MGVTKEERKRRHKMIRQMYGKIPTEELAKSLGMGLTTLRNYINQNKLYCAAITLSKEKQDYIQKAYGIVPLKEIARKTGINLDILKIYIRQNNIVSHAPVYQSMTLEKQKFERKTGAYEHLCWSCRLSTCPSREILAKEGIQYSKCPWAAALRPVAGWEAIKIKLVLCGKETDSYKVLKCPKYVEEKWNVKI